MQEDGGGGLIDEYLIRRGQAGDKDALEKLIRRYYDRIYSYCYHHVNDSRQAEDICQDTFCSMLEHLEQYRHYDKFPNYLYVIAGNKCRDFYKRKKPLYLEELSEREAKGGMEGEAQAVEFEDRLAVRELVRSLPRELEEVIILRFYQDLRYQDIGKILQISTSLAKYRVKKAVGLLREKSEKKFS